MDEMLERER
jgi:hypothetical protein